MEEDRNFISVSNGALTVEISARGKKRNRGVNKVNL